MLARWVSLLEGVFFSNTILNLYCNGSLSSLSTNLLINSTTQALSMFCFSLGLVKNTLETRSFGDGPTTTIFFPCWSKRGSPKLSQRINSNYLQTGVVTFSPLSVRRRFLSLVVVPAFSIFVLASFTAVFDLVWY